MEREFKLDRDNSALNLLLDTGDGNLNKEAPLYFILFAHGGLTYSENDSSDGWWFGFDTNHHTYYSPAMEACYKMIGIKGMPIGIYRDIGYVTGQVRRLAKQIFTFFPLGVSVLPEQSSPS